MYSSWSKIYYIVIHLIVINMSQVVCQVVCHYLPPPVGRSFSYTVTGHDQLTPVSSSAWPLGFDTEFKWRNFPSFLFLA